MAIFSPRVFICFSCAGDTLMPLVYCNCAAASNGLPAYLPTIVGAACDGGPLLGGQRRPMMDVAARGGCCLPLATSGARHPAPAASSGLWERHSSMTFETGTRA